MDIKGILDRKIDTIKVIRERLHDNAETANREFKTQKIIMNFLKETGVEYKPSDKTGVVGVLNSGRECIGIRADMDALPINGAYHACGHDYHMAVVLGCAAVLKEAGFDKCVKFIFQPAEEIVGGALPMIDEGVLKNPDVKYMIGFHVWPGLPAGKVEVKAGASMASVDDFYVKFTGRGGHAAMPQLCKNPIYPAVDFIQSMTDKSRIEYDPLDSHIITFSTINGGVAPNIIADEVQVSGTVRTFSDSVRHTIYDDIQNVSALCAQKFGCASKVNYISGYPPLINDDSLAGRFVEFAEKLLGKENVLPLKETFVAEDFAYFAENVPSIHFRLGISDGIRGMHPLHSSGFDASDDSLWWGVYICVKFIMSLSGSAE